MSKWWRGSVPLYICLMISTSLCKLSCWNAFYAKKCMSVSLHSKGKTRTYSLAHCGWIHQLRPVTTVLFYNNLNNLKYLQQIWLHYHRPNQKSVCTESNFKRSQRWDGMSWILQHNCNIVFSSVKSVWRSWQEQANSDWTEATADRVTHQLTIIQEIRSLLGVGKGRRIGEFNNNSNLATMLIYM